jgi:hypothetical protein
VPIAYFGHLAEALVETAGKRALASNMGQPMPVYRITDLLAGLAK